ncbi:hypothetical protein [Pedobacter nutrimenti]|uniref:hypothetical protein n=1 Tax=Pedobacter nutrimenti TaxID=1241337 RepID=UPI00292D4094|nr:hypothetical protein [Pedobacter nutrimenti]
MDIDEDIFNANLELTKAYCRLQIEGEVKDNAKVFRSYNPILDGKPLFSFKTEYFNFDIEPNLNHCTLTTWAIDPLDTENTVENLFVEQLAFKKESLSNNEFKEQSAGKIIVSEIDYTFVDGASEIQSLGLIDLYDMPPIDTWFYLIKTEETRLVFAWIPDEFVHYANEAVLVNCVDCIQWFEDYS